MNNLQKLVSDICGYDTKENGARDDGYYNCISVAEKLDYLKSFAENVLETEFTADEIIIANDWLAKFEDCHEDFMGSDNLYKRFIELA